ncbi:YgaP family membrane protein [Algoriphagus antarcticus]|uniref:Inner membrane protein YgaP-like transmembrane domain-containing protein n=1 Tax=Algoriphagus antarcticus TaxID=238540 RepID=A0A3E0D9Y3_9BACT|nr:DUF2892 domain-containing protein [Algoriphagus antarcticus]REG79480.1 hypothetical protein C8N25_13128 [Algoriphagus antarcticus]
MKNNLGSIDRMIRIALAIIISALYFTHVISGSLGSGLILVVGVLFITSFFSFCPFYSLFGIATKKKTKAVFLPQRKPTAN